MAQVTLAMGFHFWNILLDRSALSSRSCPFSHDDLSQWPSVCHLIAPRARSVPSMALPISFPPRHTTSPSPPADMNDPFNPRHYRDNDVELSDVYHRDNYVLERVVALD